MIKFYQLLFLLVIFASCSSENDELVSTPVPSNNHPPTGVTVKIDSITHNSAYISWTNAVDPEHDAISYDLSINNTNLLSNSTNLYHKVIDLNELTFYSGKITAKDSHNNISETPFYFTTIKYYLKFFKTHLYPQNMYGGSSLAMIRLSDGNYLIGGMDNYLGAQRKLFLLKTDYAGNEIWKKMYASVDIDGDFTGFKMIETSQNEIVIGSGFNVTKLDNNGNMIWSKKLSSYDNGYGDSAIRSLAVDTNGEIYAAGTIGSADQQFMEVGVLTKLSLSGSIIWHKTYESSLITSFNDIIIDNQELVIFGEHEVSGITFQQHLYGSPLDIAFYLLKTDKNGQKIMEKNYPNPYKSSTADGIMKRNNGNYVFYGTIAGPIYITGIFEVDQNGNTIWEKQYGIGFIKSLKETQDHKLISIGLGNSSSYSTRMYFSLFDNTGNQIWLKDTYEMGQYFIGTDVVAESDGGFRFLCSHAKNYSTQPEDRGKILVYKTDPTGNYQ